MFILLIFSYISFTVAQYNGPAMPNVPSGYESSNEVGETPDNQAGGGDQLAYQSQTEEIEGMVVVPRPVVPVHDFPLTATDLADEIVGRFGCSRTSFSRVEQYIKKSRPALAEKARSVANILQMLCKA